MILKDLVAWDGVKSMGWGQIYAMPVFLTSESIENRLHRKTGIA
jgi:hypothetical protein